MLQSAKTEKLQGSDKATNEALWKRYESGVSVLISKKYSVENPEPAILLIKQRILHALQVGIVVDSAQLVAYVRSALRQVVASYAHSGRPTLARSPRKEQLQAARRVRDILLRLDPCDRELLLRFYGKQQSCDQICAEMNVTPAQCSALKTSVRAAFFHSKSLSHSV